MKLEHFLPLFSEWSVSELRILERRGGRLMDAGGSRAPPPPWRIPSLARPANKRTPLNVAGSAASKLQELIGDRKRERSIVAGEGGKQKLATAVLRAGRSGKSWMSWTLLRTIQIDSRALPHWVR